LADELLGITGVRGELQTAGESLKHVRMVTLPTAPQFSAALL
jgi:hypothetical protein